jgi:zinc protease
MKDLEAASIEDVRDFHNTYYVPENATLVIVGDFDTPQTLQMINQYFGRVPKARRPVPRDIPKEPPQTKERRAVVEESWPLPAVVVAYHVTYDGHPDSYPLHIASKIMSDGQSARIPLELMYKRRLALTAFGSGNITEDPNLFYAVAVVQPGQTAAVAEQALIAEFEKLIKEPVTPVELQRAKNQWARDYVVGRESNQDKAIHLAHAAVIHNDIGTADAEYDVLMNVTTADVQRVARTYFTPANRVVVHVLPKGGTR